MNPTLAAYLWWSIAVQCMLDPLGLTAAPRPPKAPRAE